MRLSPLTVALALTACVHSLPYVAPAPVSAPSPTAVRASFGQAWDAVIDEFARQNIPVRAIERASGFIATEPMRVDTSFVGPWAHTFADCGHRGEAYYWPTSVVYNVVVRGDSSGATVKTTARWASVAPDRVPIAQTPECTTRGRWEAAFEESVRGRAEGKARGH